MRLTRFSDYALRALIYSAGAPEGRVTIESMARLFGISQAHLKKVVRQLAAAGFLKAVRGRAGGFTLGRPASEITIGAVLRVTEPAFGLFECHHPGGTCLIQGPCRLPVVARRATAAFLAEVDRVTLADVTEGADWSILRGRPDGERAGDA